MNTQSVLDKTYQYGYTLVVSDDKRGGQMKNLQAKTVKPENAYEVWQAADSPFSPGEGAWTWYVLKKWQADDNKPFARWFCLVKSPIVPNGELGDVYVKDIKSQAVRIK